MNQQEKTEFTIENLEGKSLIVHVPTSLAQTRYVGCRWTRNDKYGLDYLSDEISKATGIDPSSHILISEDSELTIGSDILAASEGTITLLVRPNEVLIFPDSPTNPVTNLAFNIVSKPQSEIRQELDRAHAPDDLICYLFSLSKISQIQILGRTRDYLKIEIRKLPKENLGNEHFCVLSSNLYTIRDTDPQYAWLKFDPDYMKIQ
jgi:hypothetical protein